MPVTLPPIIIKSDKPWASGGIKAKPPTCHTCPIARFTTSFCPDWVGSKKIEAAFMLSSPSNDDVIHYRAFSGDIGFSIFRNYLEPYGFRRDNVIISYVLRCAQKYDVRRKQPGYPTGVNRTKAETLCRQYDDKRSGNGEMLDGGILTYDPNLFLITISPKDVYRIPSYTRQLKRDMEKVRAFVDKGFRPMVLMGSEPAELFFPEIVGRGGAKGWRGHFKEMEYKYKGDLQV